MKTRKGRAVKTDWRGYPRDLGRCDCGEPIANESEYDDGECEYCAGIAERDEPEGE